MSIEAKESKSPPSELSKWQPSPESIQQFRIFIKRNFFRGTTDAMENKLITQYAKIMCFLRDRVAFIEQLKKLNELLIQKADERGLVSVNDKGEKVLKSSDTGEPYPQQSKVLRHVLEEKLGEFGFQPELAKLHSAIGISNFKTMIRDGFLVKDPGLGKTAHGDFSHPIQWLMIAQQQKDSTFLDMPVIEIYKSLGENTSELWNTIVDKSTQVIDRSIFEMDYWSTHEYAFSSPEILSTFLIKTEDPDLSFLRSLIVSRDNKRAQEADSKLSKSGESQKKHKEKYPNKQYLPSKDSGLSLPESIVSKAKQSFFLSSMIGRKDERVIENFLKDLESANKSGETQKAALKIYQDVYARVQNDSLDVCSRQLKKHVCYILGLHAMGRKEFDSAKTYLTEALSIHETLADMNQTISKYEILNISKDKMSNSLEKVNEELEKLEKEKNERISDCIIA